MKDRFMNCVSQQSHGKFGRVSFCPRAFAEQIMQKASDISIFLAKQLLWVKHNSSAVVRVSAFTAACFHSPMKRAKQRSSYSYPLTLECRYVFRSSW